LQAVQKPPEQAGQAVLGILGMNKISKLIAALFAIVLAAQVHASLILQTSGSKLTGATGIEVGGKLYDVTFSGGSCADLFGGCVKSQISLSKPKRTPGLRVRRYWTMFL